MENTEFLNHAREESNGFGNESARQEERPAQGRVHYLPIITAIFIIISLLISYGVSVYHGHVEPDFPYISYTAVQTPERCIFAQLINIGALLMGANVYVRFLQQRELYRSSADPSPRVAKDRRHVIASLVCGCLSALGLSMVANFQTIVMRPPHYVGAGLAFGMGVAYCWIQTSISLRHCPRGRVTIAQLLISILLSLFLLTYTADFSAWNSARAVHLLLICFCIIDADNSLDMALRGRQDCKLLAVSKTIFKVKEGRGEGTKEVELRGVYLVSTISEWLTVVAVVVFALTFCPDFSTLTLEGPRVRFSPNPRNGPSDNNVQLHRVTTMNQENHHENSQTSPPV